MGWVSEHEQLVVEATIPAVSCFQFVWRFFTLSILQVLFIKRVFDIIWKITQSKKTTKHLFQLSRSKRSVNGGPINLFVEVLVVTDQTVYQFFKTYLQTNNMDYILWSMKIYYAHYFNGVNSFELMKARKRQSWCNLIFFTVNLVPFINRSFLLSTEIETMNSFDL